MNFTEEQAKILLRVTRVARDVVLLSLGVILVFTEVIFSGGGLEPMVAALITAFLGLPLASSLDRRKEKNGEGE